MKKLLLTFGCVVALSASAQKIEKGLLNLSQKQVELSPAAKVEASQASINKAPRRMKDDGVYYKIPKGAMWRGAERPLYSYGAPLLTVAPWTEYMYENMGTTKQGDWTIVTATTTIDRNESADENNNLWQEYSGGLGAYYGVTYTEGDKSYIPSTDDGQGCTNVIDGIDFHTFFTNNVGEQKYYGGGSLENGNLYGAGKLIFYEYEYDEEGNVVRDSKGYPVYKLDENGERIISAITTSVGVIYSTPKPMSPLYVEGITIWGMVRESGLPALGDKTLTIKIFNSEDESENPEPVYELTCTPGQCVFDRESNGADFYQVNFTQKQLDEISNEVIDAPFILDFPADIYILGFDQEGINLGLMGTDILDEYIEIPENLNPEYTDAQRDKAIEIYNSASFVIRDDVTGELDSRYYSCTVPFLGFWSMFDKLEVMTEAESITGQVFDHVNAIVVSDDGQDCGNVIFSNVEGVQVYTALDWEDEESGEEMYWSDDMYDYEWIQNLTANAVTYEDGSEMGGSYYVGAVCDPLPADVKGRYAVIHLNGRGVVSDPIYILQGDITMEEILGNEGVTGDVNGDGVVNITDLNLIIDAMSGETVSGVTDINGDGTVNITDLNLVIDIMSGE